MAQPQRNFDSALEYARGGRGLPPPSTLADARPRPREAAGRSDAPTFADYFESQILNRHLSGATAQEIIAWAAQTHGDGLVMTTSFGIQSAVMLHLATSVVPRIPVIWLDTGYLPPETYRFAAELTERLDLNLQIYQSKISPARMEALYGRLWESDLDRYNQIRKVEPLRRALDELGARAWLAGLRASQTDHRATLPRIGEQDGRTKILPILDWTGRDVHLYLREHDLPYHPLWHQDYVTVGDWHSSRPVSAADNHQRDSRFGGARQECGIHLPGTPGEEESLQSSEL